MLLQHALREHNVDDDEDLDASEQASEGSGKSAHMLRVSGCVDLKLSMFACTYASAYYVMYLAVMSLDMLSDEMSSSSLEMSASSSSKDSIADNEVRRVVLGIYHQCLSQLF